MQRPPRSITGRIGLHPRGFGFVEFDGGESAFVAPPELSAPRSGVPLLEGDRVTATVTEDDQGRLSAANLTLVERQRSELFGTVVARAGKRFLRVDRAVGNTDWEIEGDALVGANLVGSIRGARIVPLRTVDPNEAGLTRVIVRHGLRSEFPPECLDLARLARLTLVTRRDLRAIPTVTIDALVTKDLDDALAVLPAAPDGALRLLVSISDVDALVPEGSALDLEARTRGTSVYLADRVIPMLPQPLSEATLSLVPGEDRAALTVELRIDEEGTVTSVDLYESLIRSHARLDYETVATFLDTGDTSAIPEGVRSTLRWLRTATGRVSVGRHARGGVEIVREEATITLDAGQPTAIAATRVTRAHRMVERLMVAANEAVARWLVERGLPGVFRVHDEPDEGRVRMLAEFAKNFGLEPGLGARLTPRGLAALEAQYEGTPIEPAMLTVLGRVLGPARYTVHPSLHFGLAAPMYVHFTSPVRRYADLTVHRIVKGYLGGERDRRAGEESLEELAVHLNDAAWRATKAENERLRMLAARLFGTRLKERFAGHIVAIKPFGAVVQLAGTGVTGTVAVEALVGGPFRLDAKTQ
ncbi:MAG: RNB domain-containing ribonuclease, partial [Myxococcales bacterium]